MGTYILQGGNRKNTSLILGNTILGDTICKNLEYKSGNTINFVISFSKEDNVEQIQGREIAKEFMQEFMNGFSEDEYHIDMVEHNDTDNLHYHIRIPKVNLFTATQLKLYWHKTDLNYKKAVIDVISNKYNLCTGLDKKAAMPNTTAKQERIDIWRDTFHQQPFDLSKKIGRAEAEDQITKYFSDAIESGVIKSLKNIKRELSSLGFNVCNEGFDRGKDFHYLTIEDENGKIRLKGDLYGKEFYKYGRKDRRETISSNKSFGARSQSNRPSGDEARDTLSKERGKRLQFISTQYKRARENAKKRFKADTNSYAEYFDGREPEEIKDIISRTRQNNNTTELPRRDKYQSKKPKQQIIRNSFKKFNKYPRESRRDSDLYKQISQAREKGYKHFKYTAPRYWYSLRRIIGLYPNLETNRAKKRGNYIRYKRKPTPFLQRTTKILLLAHERRSIQNEIKHRTEKKGKLDDRIRREIKYDYANTAANIQQRVRENRELLYPRDVTTKQDLSIELKSLQKEYSRSKECDRQTATNIATIRGNITKLANKHQQDTIKRIGEHGKEEARIFEERIKQFSGGAKEIKRSGEEYRKYRNNKIGEITNIVKRGDDQVQSTGSKLTQYIRGYFQQCIGKIGEMNLVQFKQKSTQKKEKRIKKSLKPP